MPWADPTVKALPHELIERRHRSIILVEAAYELTDVRGANNYSKPVSTIGCLIHVKVLKVVGEPSENSLTVPN